MDKRNELCLIIPHYNNYEGLIKSLDSIREEIDFDLLIIDDGSTQPLPADDFFHSKYPTLSFFILRNSHKGIITVSREGLKFVHERGYKYTARLDAGDLCIENRLSIQYRYLEANDNVYLLGTFCEYFDLETGGTVAVKRFPTEMRVIKRKMYFNSVFEHPTVMFRCSAMDEIGYYPADFEVAMDYAYFFKFVHKYKCAILPQVLVRKEISSTSISTVKRKLQVRNRIRAILQNFEFKWYFFAGLGYAAMVYVIPYSVLNKFKKYFFK